MGEQLRGILFSEVIRPFLWLWHNNNLLFSSCDDSSLHVYTLWSRYPLKSRWADWTGCNYAVDVVDGFLVYYDSLL